MPEQNYRLPTVIVPYPGPCREKVCHDVFVYLRPETNGVEVESTIMRTIRGSEEYRERAGLVYLANIPGDFISQKRIVEEHYRLQLYFATHGKAAFTDHMRRKFSEYFDEEFEEAPVCGAFEAMRVLDMTYDELFRLYVPKSDLMHVNGQSIKRYGGIYIVNYDIPAILHKNNNRTDIAVMIFRTDFHYETIHRMVDDMADALIDSGTLHPGKALSRVFHYSKGPFDQIRDAIGYLYTQSGRHEPLKRIAFARFLTNRGIKMHQILGLIRNPLCTFAAGGGTEEADIFTYTSDNTFEGAFGKFRSIRSQFLLV
jgi:hypothetical protein